MIKQKVLETAADWWIEQITGHKMNWDNGAQNAGSKEERDLGMRMFLLGNLTANIARERITDDQVLAFRDSLIRQLREAHNNYPTITLSVDYHPDRYLSEAAQEAGIDDYVFPCKTTMWIKSDSIEVKLGYGAPIKTVL